MELPRIVVTGASGFVGRHLLDALKGRYKIFAVARRSQRQSGAPVHPNILWHRVDIGDVDGLETLFQKIRDTGGAEVVVHLAAYYDFSGEEHPEYMRSNVTGLRNVLEQCKTLRLKRFIFASSTAACDFRPPGQSISETTPPDGAHIYARTKKIGEEMLREYANRFPYCIVRFAALFSDWCEYPPLYMFLGSWLSDTWTSRVLAGRGISSIPYLHVRDVVTFLKSLLDRLNEIESGEVLIASADGSVSHQQLFEAATLSYYGQRKRPIHMPRVLCRPGIFVRRMFGNISGYRPFETYWMCGYVDRQMNIDAAGTRKRLGWHPRPRLEVLRRVPFMVENFRAEPAEWYHRNTAALKVLPMLLHLKIYNMLKMQEAEIKSKLTERFLGPEGVRRFPAYQALSAEERRSSRHQLFMHLMNAIRTRDKSLFRTYCQELAERRFEQGFSVQEVCDAVAVWNEVCLKALREDPASKELPPTALRDYITVTLQFGLDEIQEVYEQLGSEEYQLVLQDLGA